MFGMGKGEIVDCGGCWGLIFYRVDKMGIKKASKLKPTGLKAKRIR